MATTTNYGWTTPDDTALVKDGASAIRTLGSSVDTTTKNLNPETTLGDIAYRSSSANVKTRLGIGTTGQVLTVASGVPSWATPATPTGGFNLITSGTFTTSSSISINSCFSATYLNYKIVIDLTAASGDCDFIARMRASGSDDTGGNYNNKAFFYDGSYNNFDPGSSNFGIGAVRQGATTFEGGAEIIVFSPFASTRTKINSQMNAPAATTIVGGVNKVTTSFDGITFRTSANDVTGSYKIYGLAN